VFVAFLPDGHGPVVADGDFADTSRQHLGSALSDDLSAWAHGTFRIAAPLGIAGISAGGYGAALLGSAHPNNYRRVCAIGGSFEAGPPVFSHEPPTVRAADSPILHARATGPATLLIAGSGDPAAVAQSVRYAGALHAARQPAEIRVVAGVHDWSLFRRELPVCLRFLVPA
jgi:enterochelin esterase-like enzyme